MWPGSGRIRGAIDLRAENQTAVDGLCFAQGDLEGVAEPEFQPSSPTDQQMSAGVDVPEIIGK